MTDFAEKMKIAIEEIVDFIISGVEISRDMYNFGEVLISLSFQLFLRADALHYRNV